MARRIPVSALPFPKPSRELTQDEALANLDHMERVALARLRSVEHVDRALLPPDVREAVMRDRKLLAHIKSLRASIKASQTKRVLH